MGFRFHRSIKLFPGVRLNLSKKGAGFSVGPKGYKVSLGPSGVRRTISIPGTGFSKIDQLSFPKGNAQKVKNPVVRSNPPGNLLEEIEEKNNSTYNSSPSERQSSVFFSKILPYSIIGLLGIGFLTGILSIVSFVAAQLLPSKPTMSVDQIVGTSIARLTEQAVVDQIFGFYTQTAVAVQSAVEQTKNPSIVLEATRTPFLPKPLDTQQPTEIEPSIIILPTLGPSEPSEPGFVPVPLIIPPADNLQNPTPSTSVCCRRCLSGKACGDACIPKGNTCYKPPGCACDG